MHTGRAVAPGIQADNAEPSKLTLASCSDINKIPRAGSPGVQSKGVLETDRKLCENGLAVAGLQGGQLSMVGGGETDAGHINEAAAVIRHGGHVLQQAERIHAV